MTLTYEFLFFLVLGRLIFSSYSVFLVLIFSCYLGFWFSIFIFLRLFGLCRSINLVEVVLHVALEVEVGQLVLLLQLEQLGKLGIGVDDTSVALVLQAVGMDVGVDLLANLSSGHLSTNGLAEETRKLVADASGLDEARGLAVAGVAALLGGGLLGNLHLTRHRLLKGLEIILHGREETNHLLELGAELRELGGKSSRGVGRIGSSLNHGLDNGSRGRHRSGGRCGSRLSGSLLGTRLGCLLGNGGRSRGGSSSRSSSSSNHLIIYYYNPYLLSSLQHNILLYIILLPTILMHPTYILYF